MTFLPTPSGGDRQDSGDQGGELGRVTTSWTGEQRLANVHFVPEDGLSTPVVECPLCAIISRHPDYLLSVASDVSLGVKRGDCAAFSLSAE